MSNKSRYINKIRDLHLEMREKELKFKKLISNQKKRFTDLINSQYYHRDKLNDGEFIISVVRSFMQKTKTKQLQFSFKGSDYEDFQWKMTKD